LSSHSHCQRGRGRLSRNRAMVAVTPRRVEGKNLLQLTRKKPQPTRALILNAVCVWRGRRRPCPTHKGGGRRTLRESPKLNTRNEGGVKGSASCCLKEKKTPPKYPRRLGGCVHPTPVNPINHHSRLRPSAARLIGTDSESQNKPSPVSPGTKWNVFLFFFCRPFLNFLILFFISKPE